VENVYNWIVANWTDIAAAYAAFVTLCSIIVKMVPNLKKGTLGKAIIKGIAIYGALNR
jgi:hypothetical protein